ncbi:unnamed protein product [Miscanthus lutarioriparius]|uniref:Uncharacterized protein n=1 Tax=Miscanthus lutarioriparius TaxID=422564 RepID=A0A811RLK8_9POAL|nr:unnamed protein product [Miscanthus lutarioriparius]
MPHVLVEWQRQRQPPASKKGYMPLPRMNKPWSSSQGKRRGGGLSRVLREQKARLYIIRRCVVMLLCYHD